MRARITPYVARASWLHHLDPRVKLAFVLVATLLTFLWPSLLAPLGVFFACLVLLLMAHIPIAHAWRVLRMMLPMLLMVFGLTALFGGGDAGVLLRLGPLRITPASVGQGALLATRLMALALVFALWLATTDQAAMVRGLIALRVPYTWGLTLALALRYLPVFASLFEQVREAQQARGLSLERRGLFGRLRAYHPILIAMIISALRNSERLGWALETRGLGAQGVQRSVFHPLRFGRLDRLALGTLTALLIGAIAWRVL